MKRLVLLPLLLHLLLSAAQPAARAQGPGSPALAHYQAGEYEAAIAVLRQEIRSRPEDPWQVYLLGLAHWKAGQLAQADSALRRVLALEPGHLKGHINLVRVLLDRGELPQALDFATVAVQLAPACAEAHRVRGRALHCLGRHARAETAYREALALDPADTWAARNLRVLLLEQGPAAEVPASRMRPGTFRVKVTRAPRAPATKERAAREGPDGTGWNRPAETQSKPLPGHAELHLQRLAGPMGVGRRAKVVDLYRPRRVRPCNAAIKPGPGSP